MDSTDPFIVFDEQGICNYCHEFFVKAKHVMRDDLPSVFKTIKQNHHPKYDALLGISGGIDSSYVAYLASRAGLRVLLTHLDNGFDTEEAHWNIQRVVEHTGWDYLPLSCDVEEIYDLKRAYLKSGVLNLEAICDHAIIASTYSVAETNGMKYVLSGSNWATEGILPRHWGYRAKDRKNILDIHKHHGTIPLKTFPTMSLWRYSRLMRKITTVAPLNHMQYNRNIAKSILVKEWGWRDYGNKHGECICTRLYQQFILPWRTGWDKRKPHFSSMICSGQMTRGEALQKLALPPYEDVNQFLYDHQFFIESLGLSIHEFNEYIEQPVVPNSRYATNDWAYNLLRVGRYGLNFVKRLRR